MNARISTSAIVLFLAAVLGCESVSEHDDYDYKMDGEYSKSQAREAGAPVEPVTFLETSQWRLVQLHGQPVQRETQPPTLKFDGLDKRVTGFTGINQISGSYELKGEALHFGPLAMTRKAGPEPMMQQESALAQALAQTAIWRHLDDGVDLLDAAGTPLLRLER